MKLTREMLAECIDACGGAGPLSGKTGVNPVAIHRTVTDNRHKLTVEAYAALLAYCQQVLNASKLRRLGKGDPITTYRREG